MKRISSWIENQFSQSSEIADRDENVEAKSSALTLNKCDGDPTPTLPVLTSLDASFFEVDQSTGFDPYNSGSFITSKSRSRK